MLRISNAFLPLALSFLAAAPAVAQSVRGTILGTVTDSSGAVVRKAKVTVREVSIGLIRTELTNDEGEYSIPQLPAGHYDVSVEDPNFKKAEVKGIELSVDDHQRVDVKLSIGQVSEVVEVAATASIVSTDSSTVGNVVDNKKVTELPLNGRNFLQLNLLVPGANQGVKGSQNQTQGGSITVNGAREQSNNFLLDGMDNNDLAINQYAVAISTEAILEFKVQASTYSAEFGRSPGGQINIATKAGTNQIHGVLYEYLRNNDLDAKNFFDRSGPIPGYKRNQFGASIGGPIRKNKTFYFGNFELARVRQGITKVATEPTLAMKSGDFTALPVTIFDPTSLHAGPTGALVRNPFPGNIIPSGMISPVGAAVLALYPTPNGPGTSTANGLFTSSPTKVDDFDQFTVRVDHRFNDSNTLFGRYSYSKENRFDTFDSFCASANNVPGFGCNTLNGGQQAVADYIRLLGPNKVNEARVSFTRVRGGIFQQNLGNDISTQLGITGTSRNSKDFGVPVITATGYDRLGEATNLPQDRHDNTYEYADSLSWTSGRHTAKFGVEVRHFQEAFLFDSSARGTVNFTPFYTAQVSTTASGVVNAVTGTGNAIADLLLGFPNTSSVSRSFAGINANTVAGLRETSTNLFAQDDFRVLPNLTLNLGIRWEYNAPTTDKYNHLATFDPNFATSTPLPYLRISTPQTPNIYNSSKREFAPRAGLAWTPHGSKTVIRAGWGLYWDIKLLNVILNSNLTAPFLTAYSFNQSTNGQPNIALANPYGGTGSPAIPSASWVENPFRDGYMQQWNVNVQHELTSSIGLTAGYVGSKGTHLDRAYDYNEPAPTASFTQALRKYPTYASISVRSPSASSIYHAMQLSFEKRFSHGLSFLSGYTFSKSIDDSSLWNGSVVDVTNFRLERGLSTFDTRHRFITSYTYDLPYGHNRQFGAHSSGVMNALLGGWQTNGIVTLQSGNPLDPTTGLQLSGTQTGTRPDVNCNPNSFSHDPAEWFNIACFSDNFIGRYGTAGRNIIIGPPTHAFDAAMLKRFSLGKEERYLQFRSEVFNVFNHPNFDNPSVTETSSTFGKITSAGVQDQRASSRQIQFALRLVF